MSISENYIPQAENLEHFNDVVHELESITNENARLKNSIVDKIDSLIKQINKGTTDNTQVINRLNRFIAQFGGSSGVNGVDATDEVESNEDVTEESSDEAQLLEQNKKLKAILEAKIRFNEDIQDLNREYQEAIDQVMWDVRKQKTENEELRILHFKEIQSQVSKLEASEFEAFEKLTYNRHILSTISSVIADFAQFISDIDHAEEVEVQKRLVVLVRLKLELSTNKTKHHQSNFKRSSWVRDIKRNNGGDGGGALGANPTLGEAHN